MVIHTMLVGVTYHQSDLSSDCLESGSCVASQLIIECFVIEWLALRTGSDIGLFDYLRCLQWSNDILLSLLFHGVCSGAICNRVQAW